MMVSSSEGGGNMLNVDQIVIREATAVLDVPRKPGDRCVITDRQTSGIIFPVESEYFYVQGDRRVLADRQHPVLIPQGASYFIECGGGGSNLLFNFVADGMPDQITSLEGISPEVMESAYRRLCSLRTRQPPGYRLAQLSILYDLLCRGCNDEEARDKEERALAPALTMMRSRFQDPALTCAMMAEACHLSTVHFRRLFLGKYKITPAQYVKQLRMEHARDLLQEQLPARVVAQEAGYADIYQFSRAYKRYFGHPPMRGARRM